MGVGNRALSFLRDGISSARARGSHNRRSQLMALLLADYLPTAVRIAARRASVQGASFGHCEGQVVAPVEMDFSGFLGILSPERYVTSPRLTRVLQVKRLV